MQGQTMVVTIIYLPAGQKITLTVAYPDGTQAVIGDQYMAVIGDGTTSATWSWTVPIGMTLGTGRASWHVPCTGGRNMDGYGDFQIVAS
ncbi:MAG: hypothetical protein ACRDFR_06185 [Candidatus Limnocylindria bacterium]